MADSNDLTLSKIKKLNRTEDIIAVQKSVSEHIPHLTAAALAAALGGTVILKLTQSETGKMKYAPVSTTEEIIQGIEWIAEYGNQFDQEGFYMIQQRPPDAKFWEMLTSRHLGKIPDEEKKRDDNALNLAQIGRKALAMPQKPLTVGKETTNLPLPSSWQ